MLIASRNQAALFAGGTSPWLDRWVAMPLYQLTYPDGCRERESVRADDLEEAAELARLRLLILGPGPIAVHHHGVELVRVGDEGLVGDLGERS